jgi:hypothetical protein
MTLLSEIWVQVAGNCAVLAVSLTILFVTYEITQTFRSWYRLRHIEGPFSASLSKWWLNRAIPSGKMHLRFWEVCNKYGKLDTKLTIRNNLTFFFRLRCDDWTKSLDYK